MVELIKEKESQAYKDSMIAASFTAWQILSAKGLDCTFGKYIDQFGLVEKDTIPDDENERLIEMTKRIVARHKAKK